MSLFPRPTAAVHMAVQRAVLLGSPDHLASHALPQAEAAGDHPTVFNRFAL